MEKKDKKENAPKEKPFKNRSANDPHQGHGRIDEDNKTGVQFRGGNQGGGSYKKRNK